MTPDEVREQSERVLRERHDSFRIFLEHEQGEACLKHIEFLGYVYRSAIALDGNGRVDPYILATREGRRQLAIEIRNHVARLREPGTDRQERAVTGLAGG